MTALETGRRTLGISLGALAGAGSVSVRSVQYHCAGAVAPSVLTAISYAVYLQAANRAAGCPIQPERLTVEALFHSRERRCHRSTTGTAKAAAHSQVTGARQAGGGNIQSLGAPARQK